MGKTVFLLKNLDGVVLEVYDNRELVKKILPVIETKLLTEIMSIEEVRLNPSVDIVGNKNFKKTYTVKEFMDYV